jgi:hypothetical protein
VVFAAGAKVSEHVRTLMSVIGGSSGILLTPVARFRWQRSRPDPSEQFSVVLQQAWIDNNGEVHWRDVPTIDV